MSRETSNLGLILYDPSEDKDVKVRDVINKVLGFTDSNTIKIDTKTKEIDTNIKTLHDSIIGTDGNVVFYNKQEVFLAVHPVGSIFLSTDGTEPAELYGGTWERIEGRFIMGASDTYPVKSTGGSATKTIAKTNLPDDRLEVFTQYTKGAEGQEYDVVSITYEHSNGSGDFSRTGRTSSLGDGTPLNILPPYYSMYIWRRVA